MSTPQLERRFGLLQATALNMSNMIGIGPFITIPLLMTALGGPQALLGWLVALVIVDRRRHGVERAGRGAARVGRHLPVPARGVRAERFGRLMAFLFIWQFILSGPLEIASGYIGFANYARYIWPDLVALGRHRAGRRLVGVRQHRAALPPHRLHRHAHGDALGRHAADDAGRDRHRRLPLRRGHRVRLSRRAPSTSRPASSSAWAPRRAWASTTTSATTTSATSATKCATRAASSRARSSSACWRWRSSTSPSTCRSSASCPGASSCPTRAHPQSDFIVSIFMERIYGSSVATVFTLLVLWTAFGSVFALLLGYSRIPYAAATDGTFFRVFGEAAPRQSISRTSRCCSSAPSRSLPARSRSAW